MDKIIELHIKNDYFVKITLMNNLKGFNIEFPYNIFTDNQENKDAVIITDNGIDLYGLVEKSYSLPKYARRIATQFALVGACAKRGISDALILIYDQYNKLVNIQGSMILLNIELSKEELEQEIEVLRKLQPPESNELNNIFLDIVRGD